MKGSPPTKDENGFMVYILRFRIVGLINQIPTEIIKVGLINQAPTIIIKVDLINQTPTEIIDGFDPFMWGFDLSNSPIYYMVKNVCLINQTST